MASITRRSEGKWRARYRDEAGREHARHFDHRVDGQRWRPNTVRQVMALLAGVFTDAVEDGFLAKSPCRDTLPPCPYREKVAPLTVEQVEALVAAAPTR